MAKKEDFYHELDTKTKRSFCSCQTLILGLVLVIILIVVGVTVLVKKVTTAVAPARKVTATRTDATNLQKRFENLTQAPGASTVLVITEQELTSILVDAVGKQPQVPLRDIQAQINASEIIVNATATTFLNSEIAISLVPKVVDGKPRLELVKIQAGTVEVPTPLTERLSRELQNMLLQLPIDNVAIRSIVLAPSKMTISGTVTSPAKSAPHTSN